MEPYKDLIDTRVSGDPLFYFLYTLKFTQTLVLDTSLKKLFILKNTIILQFVKMSTYDKHKNEQLDKNPAIFCFRQVVDKRPWSGQGLYRPLECKKGLKHNTFTFILSQLRTLVPPGKYLLRFISNCYILMLLTSRLLFILFVSLPMLLLGDQSILRYTQQAHNSHNPEYHQSANQLPTILIYTFT